jgi:hypothetical protein
VHIRFWCGNLREEDHLKDTGVDGRIVLKYFFEKRDGEMDWINLALDRADGWLL